MPELVAEEIITHYVNPNNGTGPLWCYGSPTIVRDGDRVFASAPETDLERPLLCNTRWQLFCRDGGEWCRVNRGDSADEREPCSLVRTSDEILMSVNPAVSFRSGEKGVYESCNCKPHLLGFSSSNPENSPVQYLPVWDREYEFTEHSYRGIGADNVTGEILLLNILMYDGQAWSFRDLNGQWTKQGFLRFPLRGAYPQVGVNNKAAAIMAISDVIEPNLAWREFKQKITGKKWDYDFRQLYFSFTPDITTTEFSPILTVATRDETAGHINNLDLWMGPDGDVHLLYIDRNVWHTFMRDEFFPGLPISVSLKYARVSAGKIAERRTLVECIESRDKPITDDSFDFAASTPRPDWAAFHSTDGEDLHVIYHQTAPPGPHDPSTGMFLQQLLPVQSEPKHIALENPLQRFFPASSRTGTPPSKFLDLYGVAAETDLIRYAQIQFP